ncbi:MAG TPA: hypothetical protein VMF90_26335 [Rhizobiaceae bacterium]|nr:hypothetical protein [Rhizobiaceae bacterium]
MANEIHDFRVVGIELADDDKTDSVAMILTDVRGGKVRLHLSSDMAGLLRERVSFAIDRREGP